MLIFGNFVSSKLFNFLFFGILVLQLLPTAFGQSTISGTVFDKQRNQLPNLNVELLNDLYQTQSRARTDASGRYAFGGLKNGRYFVKVFASQFDLEDQTQEQEIASQSIRGGQGAGYYSLDFYLSPRKGGLTETELSVVFSQEVPPEAKKLFEKGVELIAKNKTSEGINQLNKAIEISPNYFQAIYRIGKELFNLKQFQDAVPFFIKAVEINPQSVNSFYYLGISLHSLGKDYHKSALASFKQAITLAPSSIQILYFLGMVEREIGNYEDAERHLLQAKKLSKAPNPEIHKELAQLYANNLKKYKEAADELELYLKASKTSEEEQKKTMNIIKELRTKADTKPE